MEPADELMARVAAGERDAFQPLVETYWPVAQRTAYGVLRDADLAQDVAQECFADIYVYRSRYQPRFAFGAYVAAIARHKSLDVLRRQGRQNLVKELEDAADARTPESLYIQKLYRHTLLAAVESLPKRSQAMLKAYALEGKSYSQIARERAVTVAQVKITLYRVRKILRQVKEEWNE